MVALPLNFGRCLPYDQCESEIGERTTSQVIKALKAIEAVIEFVILKSVTVWIGKGIGGSRGQRYKMMAHIERPKYACHAEEISLCLENVERHSEEF